MNRLNRKVEYALMALKFMSDQYNRQEGQRITVKEICRATQIPFDATSRVMQQMAQKKLLRAEHGARGGYLLVIDLAQISLLDIIEVVSGPVEYVRCVDEEKNCEFFEKCNISSPLQNFNLKLKNFYRDLSLAEILGSPKPTAAAGEQ